MAALERALKILDAFRSEQASLSLAELSERTGLYKSTILRLFVTLEQYGYLARLQSGRFVLGAAVFEFGQIYQRAFRIDEHVTPVLDRLASASRESASFWIREGQHRVCLFRVESSQSLREASFHKGDRLLLDKGPTSTVLQAFSGAEGRTFDRVRDEIVTVSLGVFSPELAGIACPVFSAGGKLAGALALTGPLSRFHERSLAQMTQLVRDAAMDLTRSLGGDVARLSIRDERKHA